MILPILKVTARTGLELIQMIGSFGVMVGGGVPMLALRIRLFLINLGRFNG